MFRTLRAFLLSAALAPAAGAGGAALCVLFVSKRFTGFHFGRVDFAHKAVVDLLPLPPSLGGAEGGCAAGADDGVFYIPNANASTHSPRTRTSTAPPNLPTPPPHTHTHTHTHTPPQVAYNDLIEVNIIKNTTVSRTIAPPAQYAGTIPAFYTMQLNVATGDLWALFESSTVSWVAAATVYPSNGTSVALTPDFRNVWINDFQWRKAGVATIDSKRGLFYFVGGVGAQGNETLVGFAVGDAAKPVSFSYIAGPTGASSDIDFLGYSAALDSFVVSTFNIRDGVAAVKTLPADSKTGGDDWTVVYEWKVDQETTMELGNADLSADGLTFWVTLMDGKTRQPSFFAFDLTTGKLVSQFVVPAAQWPEMLTAEVVAC